MTELEKAYYRSKYHSKANERYILHAWNGFDCDGHGDLITHTESFRNTDGGRAKLFNKMIEYADRGYTVSVVKAGK